MGTFLTVLKYITLIPTLIQAVEGLIGKGSDKKQAVEQSASAILGTLVSTGVVSKAASDKYPAATSKLIDAFVDFFNETGVFVKNS